MRESLSIWFFSGILLLAYGLIIGGTGIYLLWHPLPPQSAPVLSQLHPELWWGGMMTAVGCLYLLKFRPR